MNKWVYVGVVAGCVLAVAGCGADGPSKDGGDKSNSAPLTAQADQGDGDDGGTAEQGGDSSSAICGDEGTPGMQALAVGIQLLAQPSLDTVLAVRTGESAFAELYDVDGMREGISDYRVLEGHAATGYDDPKVVLDQWEDLNNRMDDMINGASDPTQADIDAYTAVMGEPQDLIMTQLDLQLAREGYCS